MLKSKPLLVIATILTTLALVAHAHRHERGPGYIPKQTGRGPATVKVAVVDSGLDLKDPRFARVLCQTGHKDVTDTTLDDLDGHGTHITGLIKQYAGGEGYCIMIVKYYTSAASGKLNSERMIKAIRWAVSHGASFVNISAGGPNFEEQEFVLFRDNPRAHFIVAAGNNGINLDLCGFSNVKDHCYFPASYHSKNMIVVGNQDKDGLRAESSNFGYVVVNEWEMGVDVESTLPGGRAGLMSGTSQATAIHTGKIIRKRITHERVR